MATVTIGACTPKVDYLMLHAYMHLRGTYIPIYYNKQNIFGKK